jgi:hypothetical protein
MKAELAKHWRNGAVISKVSAVTGKLLVGVAKLATRERDGQQFWRVLYKEPTSLLGDSDWANLTWALGRGEHERHCGECSGLFRTDDSREVLCPTCAGETRQDESNEPRPFTNLQGLSPKMGRVAGKRRGA